MEEYIKSIVPAMFGNSTVSLNNSIFSNRTKINFDAMLKLFPTFARVMIKE
jgi:hypothetical protein